jgi:phage baseplate assembly protein V
MKNSFVLSEISRRLNNIVRFGTVAEIDHKSAKVRVKIGNITTTWIPWITTAGTVKLWNPPVVGEQVTVISQGGDLSLAVAIPSIFGGQFDAPSGDENIVTLEFSENTSIEFNKTNDEFLMKIEDSEVLFNKEKFKVSIGESVLEITPEKIKIHAAIIDEMGVKAGL